MITIVNVKVIIDGADGDKPIKQRFGFDFGFQKGLNIITGSNTSGKSTILSVLYYCLGMEQLLGGNKKDILDQSLSKIFTYREREYSVLHSESYLEIANQKNEKIILRRIISSQISAYDTNIIYVKNGLDESIYFLHSRGDSDTSAGFYSWLANFAGITLPIFENDDSKRIKVLYLQQIFAACFVEQTKGWSDFFAQLPFFKTKNPKTKIIEYLLGLHGLINEFQIDLLREREKRLITRWNNIVSSYNSSAANLNFIVGGLSQSQSNRSILNRNEIAKLQLITRDEAGSNKTIFEIRNGFVHELRELRLVRQEIEDKTKNKELLSTQTILITEINRINEQIEQLSKRKLSEEEKVASYRTIIKDYNTQIDLLSGEEKTKGLLHLEADQFNKCPVCNSELELSEDFEFSNIERVSTDQSILFYKTERSLYQEYIEKSSLLVQNYKSVENYLKEQLVYNQLRLQQLKEELVDDERLPSRTIIANEVSIQFELSRLNNLLSTFESLKTELTELSDQIAAIRGHIKALTSEDESDDNTLKKYKSYIKNYLRDFQYSSHGFSHITIDDQQTGGYLPVVKYGGDTQGIRLSSSASDFIRALWAFYLTLLKMSRQHPGFLVLDEPGQHAMSFDSLKKLIQKSIGFKDRQIILAISNDKKIAAKDDERKYLNDLLAGFTVNEQYKVNEIPANLKCIAPLLQV
jgi:DNA repair exonuclease SbcCD ATPase subunit